jgi:signal transduction histidine kinase
MNENPATRKSLAQNLIRDRFVLLYLAVAVVEALAYGVPLLPRAQLAELGRSALLIPFIALATIAAFDGLHTITEPNERRFWVFIGAAFSVWLVTAVVITAVHAVRWTVLHDVLFDAAHMLFYAPLLMGFEYRPHVPSARLPRQIEISRQLRWLGLTCLFLGWFSYFVIIPVQFDPSFYESLLPSALLYMTVDVVLIVRLVMSCAVSTTVRWKRIYGAMIGAAVMLLVTDTLETGWHAGWFDMADGTWTDFAWALPPLLFLAAIRLRRQPADGGPAERPRSRDEARDLEPERAGSLLISAAASFPIANVAQQTLADISGPLERAQDSAALLGMLTMAALAAAAYYVLERDRSAAERTHDRLESRLREATTLAAVSRLAAVAVRETNAHITSARIGLDHTLDALPPGHEGRETLGDTRVHLDRLYTFVQYLKAISRQLPLRPQARDLNGTILELTPAIREFASGPVTLDLKLGPDAGHVLADPGAIRDVLLTLAENAREAMPNGGTFTIQTGRLDVKGRQAVSRAIRPGLYGRLAVHDTGLGMSRDMVNHAFEPFYNARDTGHGRGLGLASVYAIVAQHGGTVTVESEVDAGTSFEILLPAAGRAPAS